LSLVSPRERHLKWQALDPVEAVLYVGCGACIIGFSVSVLFDVFTRQIGYPWLWLQQVTTGCFTYGIFIGMALASRRNEHMYLTEIVQSMQGAKRRAAEVFARVAVFAVAMCMVVFGWQNFLLDMGSYRMPSLIPLGTSSAEENRMCAQGDGRIRPLLAPDDSKCPGQECNETAPYPPFSKAHLTFFFHNGTANAVFACNRTKAIANKPP